MEPHRRAVVESYLKHFPGTPEGYLEPTEQSAIATATIKSVRKDVPDAPFYRLIDFATMIPEKYSETDDIMDLYNPMYQAKLGPAIQFHNWTKKLVDRLEKYQGRGIEVIDAPIISDGKQLRRFWLTS